MWMLGGENMQFQTVSLFNQDKCLRSHSWNHALIRNYRFNVCGWHRKKNTWRAIGSPARLLVVLDGDYSPLWLDQPSLSWVFAAAVCGLIESERHGGSEETRWLAVFLWSAADWHAWLCGRRQMFQILPLRPDFNTLTWREKETPSNDFCFWKRLGFLQTWDWNAQGHSPFHLFQFAQAES